MIFIVGVGRSGTSLLHAMLNSHPSIAFLPEINLVRRFLATNRLEKMRKRKGVQGLKDFLLEDRWLKRTALDLDEVFDKVDFSAPQISWAIYNQILKDYLKREGRDIPGDKDPRSIEYLPVLHKWFPDAYIINMIRDPRDVLLSKMKAGWSRHRSYYWHIFANRVQLELGLRDSSLFGKQYMEVRYEQLVTDPKSVLEDVCERIGLTFEGGMLDFSESSKKLVAREEIQWKEKTLGPLMRTSVGKWKKGLTEWQVALSEAVVTPAFDHYGYVRSNGQKGRMKSFILACLKLIYSVATYAYLLKKRRPG